VLFNLSNQPDRRARIRDLTRHLLLTQPSISRLVDRLASKGIVEKTSDPGVVASGVGPTSVAFRRLVLDEREGRHE